MAATKQVMAALRADYADLRERYAHVAKWTSDSIAHDIKAHGIHARHECRAKDIDSLIKKAYRKGYTALEDLTDLAGARVIVSNRDDIENICSIIEAGMEVVGREDKNQSLGASQLGYRGVHLQIRVPETEPKIGGFQCEIQVRTRAEHLWSDYSHELLYKSDAPLPAEHQRAFNRLAALIEIFDDEVVRTMNYLDTLPKGAEYTWARLLESMFLDVGESAFDRELTMSTVQVLHGILAQRDADDIELQYARLERFFDENRSKIERAFERERRALGSPVIRQPESILSWFMMDTHLAALTDGWRQELDLTLLDDLATAWGVRLPEAI